MPRVVHFEIHADEPKRAVRFYEAVFGWDIARWEGPTEYWLVTTGPEEGPGINGAIMPRVRGGSTYNTIDVPSIDEYAQRVLEAGGTVVMPRTAVPGVGYMAYCADTEGNVFGIMEVDEAAE
jgi:predicted enzyme related to lactoylglutathione lyase